MKFNLPLSRNSTKARRANEPRIFNRSDTTDGVINLYCGTSLYNFSYVALSNRTWLFSLSRTFPLDHFFFLALPPPPPSFFFWVFCGCLAEDFESFFGGCNHIKKLEVRLCSKNTVNNFASKNDKIVLSLNLWKISHLYPKNIK